MPQIRIQKQRNRSTRRQRETTEIDAATSTWTAPDLTAADELLCRIDELVAEA